MMQKLPKQMSFILLTMFLNFLGFSIIIPIIPYLVQHYVPQGSTQVALFVGILMSSYAFCQFLAAPGLGMLSDRFGRRPVLLISLLGSIVGYLFLAIGGSLWILFIGRIIDGLTGGNISTVFAYVADITKSSERSKYYGLLGAAGGIGFMAGPAIGGLLAGINLTYPLYFAAAVTLINMLWGYFILPESLSQENRINKFELSHLNPLSQFFHLLSIPAIRIFFGLGLLFFIAATMLQGNASVFMKDVFHWGPTNVGLMLFTVGVVDIIAQGYLTGKLLPIFGDIKVAFLGLILNCIGLIMIGSVVYIHSPVFLLFAVIIFVLGDGFFEPTFSGLISKSVPPSMQGRIQGANQGIQSIARFIGPLFAAWLYQDGRSLPYYAASIIIVGAIVLTTMSLSTIKGHGHI